MSELVREAMRQYEGMQGLKEIQAYGDERARAAGILTEQDVVRIIHEDRAERRTEAMRRSRKAS